MSDALVDRCACGHFAVMHAANGKCLRGHQTPIGTMPSPKEPAPCSCTQWTPICAVCGYPREPRCPCVEQPAHSTVIGGSLFTVFGERPRFLFDVPRLSDEADRPDD